MPKLKVAIALTLATFLAAVCQANMSNSSGEADISPATLV